MMQFIAFCTNNIDLTGDEKKHQPDMFCDLALQLMHFDKINDKLSDYSILKKAENLRKTDIIFIKFHVVWS